MSIVGWIIVGPVIAVAKLVEWVLCGTLAVVLFLMRLAGRDVATPPETVKAKLSRARLSDRERARLLAARAWDHSDNGAWDSAIADLTEALRLRPDNTGRLSNRAFAYWEIDRLDLAIADYQRAAELAPRNVKIQLRLAYCYFQGTFEFDKAVAVYDAILKFAPKTLEALKYKAIIASFEKRDAEAAALYDRILSIDPNYVDALYCRAAIHSDRGEHEQAMAMHEKAVARDPDSAFVYQGRAYSFAAIGDYVNAVADADRAVALSPDEPCFRATQRKYRALLAGDAAGTMPETRRPTLMLEPRR